MHDQPRADERTSRTPVIVLTGKGLMGDAEKAFSLGATAYIQKPFDVNRLREKVKGYLDQPA